MEDSRKIQEILQDYSVQQIEKEIIRFHESSFDSGNISYLLQMRKDIINHNVLQHQEEILPDIIAYNDALIEALRITYEKYHIVYEANKALGEDIEVDGKCLLGKDYPKLHPLQDSDRDELWWALWDSQYAGWDSCVAGWVVSPYDSFDDFIGKRSRCKYDSDIWPKNWNAGLDEELTKNLHLTLPFSQIFLKSNFAITDFIYCRDFYHEITVKINY